jgi:condensation domain-containing protein/AMP-binding enzyme
VARDHEGEEKRLVAYVIANQPARVSELRAWLRERLPEFMTPAAFVLMDALPLTPKGKVDRKALPAPDFSSAGEESPSAPRTQIEEVLRTTLLQLGDEQFALLVTMHHIVSDAWSVGIFVRELSALYSSFAREEESPLPALNVQYADFSRWQQQWFQGDVLASQMTYWKQHLSGAPALLNFPTDRPRPAVQKFQGESRTLVLNRALAESLKILSRRQGATLFMTLLAAFKALLFRYSGQPDIVVGTPVAGRNRSDIESLIEYNTDLFDAATMTRLLGPLQTTARRCH